MLLPLAMGRGVLISLSYLAFVLLVAGPIGFQLTEGWSWFDSFYATAITISTVGYGDMAPVSSAGRLLSVVIVLTGLGAVSYTLVQITAFIMEGHLNRYLRQINVDKKIRDMKDHYIVCGVGHTGSHVMQELIREGVPFVAVDVRQDLPDDARLSGNPFVVGDATDDDVLERAGIERAAGVAAALHDDAKNLFLVVTARALNPNVRIVANTIEDNSGDKMLRAGANAVVFTGQVGAYRLANQLLRPNVATFTETMSRHDMDPSFDEFCLGDDSPHIGKSLDSLQLQERFHLYPIAIRHGDDRFIYNPPGKYILREQDTLVVIVTTARSKELKQYLRPESETP